MTTAQFLKKKSINNAMTVNFNLPLRFKTLRVPPHSQNSLVGIVMLFIFVFQIASGVLIALSLTSEPLNIPASRAEEDQDDLYTDDNF